MKKVIDQYDMEEISVEEYQKSLTPLDYPGEESGGGVWSEEVKAWLDLNTLKGLFFGDDWVYILVDRIASKISSQKLRVMKRTIKEGKAVNEPEEDNPVQKLLEQPSDNQTYEQFMYSLTADYGISGNGLVYRPSALDQLIHIPVEMIQLDFDTDGKLRTYRVIQYNTAYEMPIARDIMKIDPKQIAHVRRPNPSSALWGLSPFIPGRKSILFNRYSLEYLNNFYLKGAQPGLVLDLSDAANEKQALRLLRSMEMAHTGRRNQRRNMVLPKGVKATTVQPTLSDQQLKDYISQNRETIINIMQVPKHELSISEAGSLGSEEYKTALKNFWNGPLKTIMKSIAGSLTKLLADKLGEDRYLEFDVSDVDVLQEDQNAKADLSIKLLQTHTLNEVRAKVFQADPLPGGDTTPTTQKPAQAFSMGSKPEMEKELEAPKPEIITEDMPVDNQKILDKNKEVFETFKSKGDWWKRREQLISKDEAKRFGEMHGTVLDLFADQIASALKVVKRNLGGQGIKSIVTKAEFKKTKLKRDIRAALNNFEERWIDETIKVLEATLNIGYDAQLVLPFNIPNRSELEVLRAQRLQGRKDMLENRLSEMFSEINKTTTDKILRIIEEGVGSSRSLQDIAKNIIDEVADPKMSNSRAMTITRTEVLTASSIGQAAAMQDASEVIPNLKKMWINAGDDRVRGNPKGKYKSAEADHWTIGGEMQAHDKSFSNGLAFPRDPSGAASEVINCRCTFVMIHPDDADSLGIQGLQSEWSDLQNNSEE